MKSSSAFSVVSIGDLVADVMVKIEKFPVEADQNQLVEKIQLEPGGAGNFLIAGSRLKMKMIALGALGKDYYGSKTLSILSEEGIDTGNVIIQKDGSTTTVFVLVDNDGHHVFLGQYGIGPKINLTEDWKKIIDASDAVMCWGYTLHEQRLAEVLLDSMEYANDSGKNVFFDPGPYVKGVSSQTVSRALKATRCLLLTEDEIPLIIGKPGGLEGIQNIFDLGPHQICIKRGASGCIIHEKSHIVEHPGYRVEVRDTTAAGDAFAAAYIYASLKRWPLGKIAAFANAMGAAKVAKFGSGKQVPDYWEVMNILDMNGEGFHLSTTEQFELI